MEREGRARVKKGGGPPPHYQRRKLRSTLDGALLWARDHSCNSNGPLVAPTGPRTLWLQVHLLEEGVLLLELQS